MNRYEYYKLSFKNTGVLNTIRNNLVRNLFFRFETKKLRSIQIKYPVTYRPNTSDSKVFSQIFIEGEYGCFDNIDVTGLILDLGANVGYSSTYFLSKWPNCFVVAVEPDIDNFQTLERNLLPYAGRYLAVHAAVWPENTTLYFEPATMGPKQEWGRRVTTSRHDGAGVKALTIESLVEMTDFAEISLLKMDIEGAEQEVFSRNSKDWLAKTENFCIEVHGPEAQDTIDHAIRDKGYSISSSGELMVGIRAKNEALAKKSSRKN